MANKAQTKDRMIEILELAKVTHCSERMTQKLYKKHGISIDDETCFRWMFELKKEGKCRMVNTETGIEFAI